MRKNAEIKAKKILDLTDAGADEYKKIYDAELMYLQQIKSLDDMGSRNPVAKTKELELARDKKNPVSNDQGTV